MPRGCLRPELTPRLLGWRRVTGYVRTGADMIDSSRIDFLTEGFVANHGTTSTTRENSTILTTAFTALSNGAWTFPRHPCKIPPRLALRHLGRTTRRVPP
jgi:hypothetical protein